MTSLCDTSHYNGCTMPYPSSCSPLQSDQQSQSSNIYLSWVTFWSQASVLAPLNYFSLLLLYCALMDVLQTFPKIYNVFHSKLNLFCMRYFLNSLVNQGKPKFLKSYSETASPDSYNLVRSSRHLIRKLYQSSVSSIWSRAICATNVSNLIVCRHWNRSRKGFKAFDTSSVPPLPIQSSLISIWS